MGRTREGRGRGLLRALPSHPFSGTPMRTRPATAAGRSTVPRNRPSSIPFSSGVLLSVSLLACLLGAAGARSYEYYHEDGNSQGNRRITCYTCVNVSTNDECNRFAIDRPCPEGGDYCLTLHVMEGRDMERSLLVNKRCASLEDCAGDSTGCITAFGQTQCISCCDQPYCNDSVPSNETNAVFYRSSARSYTLASGMYRAIWTIALIQTLKTFGGLT